MHDQVDRLMAAGRFLDGPLATFANRYPTEIVRRGGSATATYGRDDLPEELWIHVAPDTDPCGAGRDLEVAILAYLQPVG